VCGKYQRDAAGDSIEIKAMMDTWTLQMGYPVVTVRQTGSQISASQQRFLYNAEGNFTEEFSSPYGLDLCYSNCFADFLCLLAFVIL